MTTTDTDFDAVLLVSFGGPERQEDVLPFLRNVTTGRNVPEERLRQVAEHYLLFEGKSPINGQCRDLAEAIGLVLTKRGIDLPVYWGNRNWNPLLVETLGQMASDGIRSAAAVITSPFSSYSSCRQYLENISEARAAVGPKAPRVQRTRQYFNHPGFIRPMAEHVRESLDRYAAEQRTQVRLVFTAHSIPLAMASKCRYEEQLLEAAQLVAEYSRSNNAWDLVFQSRSGPPKTPWLGPQLNDHLAHLAEVGVEDVMLVPIGFISDHMEVIYDLDVEAKRFGDALGIRTERVATVGTDRSFVAALCDVVQERLNPLFPKHLLGNHGVINCLGPDCCPV